MKTLFLLLLSSLLLSNTYPCFTEVELETIEQESRISKNRIIDYQKNMLVYKNLPKEEQLKRINFYLNGLLPQYDEVIQKLEDNWATPKEFLYIGYGDCEDYAIIKYYSLIKLEFDEKKLFLTIVKEKFRGGKHMVLSYLVTDGEPPLVLDNLSFKILDLKTREDLEAELFINSTGVYKLTQEFKLLKVANKYKKFEELKTKVKNNY